jgi:hypothetical protein
MGEIITREGRIAAVDDMIARAKKVLVAIAEKPITDETLKLRQQTERELKKLERHRSNL